MDLNKIFDVWFFWICLVGFLLLFLECFLLMGMLNGIILDYEILGLFIIDEVYFVFYVCVIMNWYEIVFIRGSWCVKLVDYN